jgi:LacI family transcriptional regulator
MRRAPARAPTKPKRRDKKPVTRRDVALRANVSTAVVSYVLNRGPRPVAPETRDKVERAIAELGYFPNEVARSLRARRTSTIGLIVPDIAVPEHAELAAALHEALRAEHQLLLLCDSRGDPEQEHALIELLRNKRVDGVVFIPARASRLMIRPLMFAGIPMTVLARRVPHTHSITIDFIEAGSVATAHLTALGHRRIALLDGDGSPEIESEVALGYRQALASARLAIDESAVVDIGTSIEEAQLAAARELRRKQPATAFIASGDAGVLGVLSAARALGLSVPQDISVVSIGTTAAAAHFGPGITGVEYSRTDMAALAARTLLDAIEERDRASASERVIEARFVQRGSCARRRSLP